MSKCLAFSIFINMRQNSIKIEDQKFCSACFFTRYFGYFCVIEFCKIVRIMCLLNIDINNNSSNNNNKNKQQH